MSIFKTLATAKRVINQLKHDHRTLGIALFVPCLLLTLLKYLFNNQPQMFNMIAPVILAIFPLVIMFLITSIAMLRERTSGTLDRLMTTPISKADLIFGYALAFCWLAFLQACVVSLLTLGLLGVTVAGGAVPIVITAVLAALLGTAMGLLVSAGATTEFQAVQLVMPIVMPQVLLSGLFAPRDQMAVVLQWLSDIFPVTYAVDAMKQISLHASWTTALSKDLIIIVVLGLLSLVLGSITIRRQEG